MENENLYEFVLDIKGFGRKKVHYFAETEAHATQVMYASIFNMMGQIKDDVEIIDLRLIID